MKRNAARAWAGTVKINPTAFREDSMKIYQAGPLFTEAEQNWHRGLKAKLEAAGHDVVWPYELFNQEEIKGWGPDAPRWIMEIDSRALEDCEAVVALLDGPQVDDGTAWEIGFAHAKGIPVYGIRTDFRQAGDTPHAMANAMIEGSCVAVVRSVEELLLLLSEERIYNMHMNIHKINTFCQACAK